MQNDRSYIIVRMKCTILPKTERTYYFSHSQSHTACRSAQSNTDNLVNSAKLYNAIAQIQRKTDAENARAVRPLVGQCQTANLL